MAVQYKSARCTKNDVITSTYHDLWFDVGHEFSFLPGQFISVKVNETRINSYSIAGRVDDHEIGLIVDIKPGGPGSKFFESLEVGQEISYLGPLGKFVLHPDDGSEELIFLGTGSGIAPLKAMIETALFERKMTIPMTLWFGLRNREDIFWDHYFDTIQAQFSNFKFKLCLSRPDNEWKGISGHITDFLKETYPDAAKKSVYLCGAQGMIEEATEIMKGLGMPEDRIYHEKFY